MIDLTSNWSDLMKRLGFNNNSKTLEALQTGYAQTHRHYHTINHIHDVLNYLGDSHKIAQNYDAVETALWFHDAIYDPQSVSNELDSANWALAFLKANTADESFAERVYGLILATQHNVIPKQNDDRLIVDIDLSILGSTPDRYNEFEAQIRSEYQFVPIETYKQKRKDVLMHFLARDRIYSHPYFFDRLEAIARENIIGAIKCLN